MKSRRSGILLHLTSLPSEFGVGDMGPEAYRFVDFLAAGRQSLWQILPLNPTDPILQNSPYLSTSAFAGNPLLISPELLVQEEWLGKSDLEPPPEFGQEKVDYPAVHRYKKMLLDRAYQSFKKRKYPSAYERFCAEQSGWLEDFALFMALKSKFDGRVWSDWPSNLRDRETNALGEVQRELKDQVDREKFFQFLFFHQWISLKNYCHQKGIQIIGDIPIYVNYGSSDLWVYPEFFNLDDNKKPLVVAGVPPDYFSATGQLWGNPLYRWDALKAKGFDWWVRRIAHNLRLFDFVRIDHFRGLVGYWEVPATEKNAIHGRWVEAPAMDFFTLLARKFSCLPIIAEDLGLITPDVREVINHFELLGMKVLLFAFGEGLPLNPYIPHNLPQNCVAYTGTHDNNTVKGWFKKEATGDDKKRLSQYLGRELSPEELPRELIRLLMMSVANTVIFPIQDVLGLGEEARMNHPSTAEGNWEWRLSPVLLTSAVVDGLREMTEIYGRS
jgi:4-alpha-glucanotransferase